MSLEESYVNVPLNEGREEEKTLFLSLLLAVGHIFVPDTFIIGIWWFPFFAYGYYYDFTL